jgi:endonuclease YncB( thermonuclease family)
LYGLLLSVGLFASLTAFSFGPYPATVLEVKDGDTVRVRAEIWPGFFREVDVRVRGIDTPETRRGKKSGVVIPECEIALGNKAKQLAQYYLHEPTEVLLVAVDPGKTKYAGRISGDLLVDGSRLSHLMLLSGFAKPYSGGAREVWPCEELNKNVGDIKSDAGHGRSQ